MQHITIESKIITNIKFGSRSDGENYKFCIVVDFRCFKLFHGSLKYMYIFLPSKLPNRERNLKLKLNCDIMYHMATSLYTCRPFTAKALPNKRIDFNWSPAWKKQFLVELDVLFFHSLSFLQKGKSKVHNYCNEYTFPTACFFHFRENDEFPRDFGPCNFKRSFNQPSVNKTQLYYKWIIIAHIETENKELSLFT